MVDDTKHEDSSPPSAPMAWPAAPDCRVVFLVDAANRTERRIVEAWIARNRPAECSGPTAPEVVPIPCWRRPRKQKLDPRFETAMAAPDDPLMAPLRVAWFPPGHEEGKQARFRDLLFSNPRDPNWIRERWTLWRHPELCHVIAGEPARLSELHARWAERTKRSDIAFPVFVAQQAGLALERAERKVRGARYKVPKMVAAEILGSAAFRARVASLARELGRSEESVRKQAARALREIAAKHSPFLMDLAARLIHHLYTMGYEEKIRFDREQLDRIFALGQQFPLAFLPSHKSNLDHLLIQYVFYREGQSPNHTAGGINMNFFPVGPIVRRSGVFFIRRTFRDNELYKFVLRSYLDYLIEKRFHLEWYIEGGRSRTGKLLPPRFGLLAYVADAYHRGKSEDIYCVPVSITYDQIADVGAYVAEQTGAKKERESFGWFVRTVQSFRRSYGRIHIRFHEPVSMRQHLGPPNGIGGIEESLDVQKFAFRLAHRINLATPITPISLVTLALLGAGDRSLTLEEVFREINALLRYVQARKLPTTEAPLLPDAASVRATLAALMGNGVVSCYSEGAEEVFSIAREQALAAAYYRNTIIHFFVARSIACLALLKVATEETGDPVSTFWDHAFRLRDTLKFEFFFAQKDGFRGNVLEELGLLGENPEAAIASGSAGARALLAAAQPLLASRVLRSFLESYLIVASALERIPKTEQENAPLDESALLRTCQALGKQFLLQKRIVSAESISQMNFQTALKLAHNRGLLDPGAPHLPERRASFAAELREIVRRLDAIDALVASRRAGLVD
jgi:glycerol-3-phosphate O-acyltransferase